jgi:hypothetical protein
MMDKSDNTSYVGLVPKYKVGDIITDISEVYYDQDMHGIVTDIILVMGQFIYHVKFFGDEFDRIQPLYEKEISKVS